MTYRQAAWTFALLSYAHLVFAQSWNTVTVQYVGGTVLMIMMAFVGGLLGTTVGKPIEKRSMLFCAVILNGCVGYAAAVLIPIWRHWEIPDPANPPFALIVAVLMRGLLPVANDTLPALWRRWAGIPKEPAA